MDVFLSKYWELICCIIGALTYMLKLYIDNTMMKFSKMTADNMTEAIKELMNLTERHHTEIQQDIKEQKNDFDLDIKDIRREIRYIKDNYVKEKK